jgi:hypothetical protein
MISRLLGLVTSLVAYFCVATCLAEAIMIGYAWSAWQLDRKKLVQVLAIAYGIDLAEGRHDAQSGQPPPPEQVSLEEIAKARAIHVRHLELREQALKTRYEKEKEDFEARLLALQQDAQSGGIAQLTSILEKIKAPQAKEQILRMLADNQIDEVVAMLNDMQGSKRAKIIGEFKTPEESEKLSEVLRRIREGAPKADLAKKTEQQLQPSPPAGP